MDIQLQDSQKPYTILIITQPQASLTTKILSPSNTNRIYQLSSTNRIIIIMIYGQILNFISQLKIKSKESFIPINGVKYNKTISSIIANCNNDRLRQYFRRLRAEYYNFTEAQKMEFVKLAMEYRSYKKYYEYKYKINTELYRSQRNQMMYIDSPIIQLLPQIMQLQEKVMLNAEQERIISQNPNVYIRVMRQIQEVNAEFLSLRTIISPEMKGRLNVFNFIMFPNDGAFCSLPLIGRIIIPNTYPRNPPVFHLYTRTNRFNLDVYNSYATGNDLNSSSICFDIVKPIQNRESRWKPEYTITTVVASIMDAIVSYKVQQMYGGQKEQFVTMESLASSYNNVKRQVQMRLKELNKFPKIPVIKSSKLMCDPLQFIIFKDNNTYIFNKTQQSLVSGPIHLQSQYKTVQFQLINLTSQFVLSFILINNAYDFKGNKQDTVIFRNGVTATAAKKLVNKPLTWFYHGKPLNGGDMKINLTITPNQFAMSYIDESTNGEWILHGDTPLTSFKEKIVGDLTKTPFKLMVYVKNKNPRLGGKFIMKKVRTNVGYIHNKSQFQ